MREFTLGAAAVLGLVAGFLATFPILLAAVNIYYPLQQYILPAVPFEAGFFLFLLGLYAIWFFAFWTIKRRTVGQLNFIILFLFVLPLPSIVFAYSLGGAFVR